MYIRNRNSEGLQVSNGDMQAKAMEFATHVKLSLKAIREVNDCKEKVKIHARLNGLWSNSNYVCHLQRRHNSIKIGN